MARLRISDQHKQLLIELYKRTRKTVDDLPYTELRATHGHLFGL